VTTQFGFKLKSKLHPFYGLFSWTAYVSWYQKARTSLDLIKAKDNGVLGWLWHQLDNMKTICTSLQTDNHTNTHHSVVTGWMLFLTPNQQCKSAEGKKLSLKLKLI